MTRAIHLGLCADLTTEEFMSALRWFCARRESPNHVYSDNGFNFQGAHNEIRKLKRLNSEAT